MGTKQMMRAKMNGLLFILAERQQAQFLKEIFQVAKTCPILELVWHRKIQGSRPQKASKNGTKIERMLGLRG